MNNLLRSGLFFLIFIFVSRCATVGSLSGFSSGLKLPSYSDSTLQNGLKILMIEDHSLPYVTVGLLVRAGASADLMGKSGLADLTSSLLERGTKSKSAEIIADEFGQLGSEFGSSADYDFTYFSTSGLSSHQQKLVDLFIELITEPVFSSGEVLKMKSEMIADIKRSYDQPAYVASRLYGQLLFGGHPYGRSSSGTVRDVKAINQKDVIRFYLKNYRPNNSMLVLVGDFNKDVLTSIEAKLEKWEPRSIDSESKPVLSAYTGLQLQLAARPDLKQTEVRMGHYGVQRAIEDYQTLKVAETILGSGFTSRLTSEIREKRGLTYSIQSAFDARKDIGPFTISASTRHEKVGELVRETLGVFSDFYKNGVTEQEVSDAKGYLQGSFPRLIETPEGLAKMLVSLRFYGVSDNYLKDYIKNLQKITADDVNKVIRKYYHPDQMRVLIYGPENKTLDQLRPIGAVEVKKYQELL